MTNVLVTESGQHVSTVEEGAESLGWNGVGATQHPEVSSFFIIINIITPVDCESGGDQFLEVARTLHQEGLEDDLA